MSNEKVTPHFTANKILSPKQLWMNNSRIRLELKGSCLKQDKAPFTRNSAVHLFIVYELGRSLKYLNAVFTLKACLFGAVKITKNSDPDEYSYSGYGIGFDSRSPFSIPNFDWGKNDITFGVDMSSSLHIDNENKDILILGKVLTQGLDNATLTTEANYAINFSRSQKKLFKYSL